MDFLMGVVFWTMRAFFLLAGNSAESADASSVSHTTAVNSEMHSNMTVKQFVAELKKADSYFKKGEYKKALDIYLNISAYPALKPSQKREILLRAANCYYNLGEYEDVLALLSAEDISSWCLKDRRCYLLRGLALLRSGAGDRGEPLVRKALLQKFEPVAAYELALYYFSKKSYSKAINILKRIIALSSGGIKKKSYLLLAKCYFRLRDWENAARYFKAGGDLEKAKLASAYSLSLKGNEYFARGDYEKAIEYYEKALSQKDETALRISLASAYIAVGDAEHLARAESVLKPLKSNPMAAVLLVSVYAKMGRTREASKLKSRIERLLERDPAPNRLLAVSYFDMGDYAKAAEYIERAVSLGGNYSSDAAVIYYAWGIDLLNKGRARESIEKFRRALRFDPSFGEAREALKVALREKRLKEAAVRIDRAQSMKDILKVLSTYEEIPEVFQMAARKFSNEPLKAMEILKRGIDNHPGFEPLYRDYMAMLKKYASHVDVVPQEIYEEALSLFKVAVTFNPTPYVLASYAELLEMVGRDGSPYIEKAVRGARGADPQTFAKIAKFYYLKGDYEKALEFYKKAHEKDPGEPSYFYNMAFVLYKLGQSEKALQMLERGLKKFPAEAPFYYLSAKILFARGEYKKAYTKINKALALAPYSNRYKWLKANIAYSAGMKKEARKLLIELQSSPGYSLKARKALASLFPDTVSVYNVELKAKKIYPFSSGVLCLEGDSLLWCREETFELVKKIIDGVEDFAVYGNVSVFVGTQKKPRKRVIGAFTSDRLSPQLFPLGKFSRADFYFAEDGIYLFYKKDLYYASPDKIYSRGTSAFRKVMARVQKVYVSNGVIQVRTSKLLALVKNGKVIFKPQRGMEVVDIASVGEFSYVLVRIGSKMFILGVRDGKTEEKIHVPEKVSSKLHRKVRLSSDGVNIVLWSRGASLLYFRSGEDFKPIRVSGRVSDVSVVQDRLFVLTGRKVQVYSIQEGKMLGSFDASGLKVVYMGG